MEIVCPRCGVKQSPDAISFECEGCGTDLAKESLEARRMAELRESQQNRRIVGSGRLQRTLLAAAVIGGAALVLFFALRFLPELFVERDVLERALEEPPPPSRPPPVLRNELPPPLAARVEDVPIPPEGAAWPVPGSGVVRGRIAWQRKVPSPQIPFLVSDPACGAAVTVPRFAVGEMGGIGEALVVVVPGNTPAPAATQPGEPLVATMRGCLPGPRLLAGPPGTPVRIRSVGSVPHRLTSTQPLPGLPTELAPGAAVETQLPAAPGTTFVEDAAHPWERLALVAVPNVLWAEVNAEGFFRIPDVPPGPATVRIYTEGTGPFERRVQVAESGEVMLFVDVADETPGFVPAAP